MTSWDARKGREVLVSPELGARAVCGGAERRGTHADN